MSWLRKGKAYGIDPVSFLRVIEAAGLARTLEHMTTEQFAIVSASRYNLTPQQNDERTGRLKEMIRSLGESNGFLPAKGVWKGAAEDSLLIPNIGREQAQSLAAAFDQEAFIWGEGGQWYEIDTVSGAVRKEGNVMEQFHFLGTGEQAEDAEAYTEMKGRRWTLRPTPESLDAKEVESFRVGGYVMKGRRWALVQEYDLDRKGQAYFFLWGPESAKHASPRFGIAVHDNGDKTSLRYGDGAGRMPIRSLAAYLPLVEER